MGQITCVYKHEHGRATEATDALTDDWRPCPGATWRRLTGDVCCMEGSASEDTLLGSG